MTLRYAEEARVDFANHARQRCTGIQAVAQADLDGRHTPTSCGETPLIKDEPCRPDDAYFQVHGELPRTPSSAMPDRVLVLDDGGAGFCPPGLSLIFE